MFCSFSRSYVASYIDFPKPLIGVINGPAVGVSVTVLGMFDAVFATDKVGYPLAGYAKPGYYLAIQRYT